MFQLPESLTIHNVAEFHAKMLEYISLQEEKGEGIFDAGALREIDTAGLQLLLSFSKSAFLQKKSLQIINRDSLVQRLCQLSGTGDIFDKGEEA